MQRLLLLLALSLALADLLSGCTSSTPPRNLVLALDPASLSVQQAGSVTTRLKLTPVGGLAGSFSLSLVDAATSSPLPGFTLSPAEVAVGGPAPVSQTLTVGAGVSPQLYKLKVRATWGRVYWDTPLDLNVQPFPVRQVWLKQSGTAEDDAISALVAGADGSLYVAGSTRGTLFGPNSGKEDVFLAKYDRDGSLIWGKQIGTSQDDFTAAIAVDGSGNVYVAGDAPGPLFQPNPGAGLFLAKFDATGALVWGQQLGSFSHATSVAVDRTGRVYLAGYTYGGLFGPETNSSDAFLAQYDPSGTLLWGKQFGTGGFDDANAVAVGAGGEVYVAGSTTGSLFRSKPGPDDTDDAFLARYDGNGNLVWGQQFGTPNSDLSTSVAVSAAGEVYAAGYIAGVLDTFGNVGQRDIFLTRFSP